VKEKQRKIYFDFSIISYRQWDSLRAVEEVQTWFCIVKLS